MNYLLVMPRGLADNNMASFPLGLPYISAAMKQAGYAVHTLNLEYVDSDIRTALEDKILNDDIDVICTGGLSRDCHKVLEIFSTARKIKADIITIAGGGLISSDPETAMAVIKPDIGVIGEGEITICELAHALDNKLAYHNIDGLIYWDAAKSLKQTSPRKVIANLDSLPFPDFDGFGYRKWSNENKNLGFILSDRSCPFKCTFCFNPTGNVYRQRSLDNIFEEIDFQVRNYGIRYFSFVAELFATKEKRVREFCVRMKSYDLTWSCCLRVSDANEALVNEMKSSGCIIFSTGFESADDSILKSMRKGTKAAQIENAVTVTSNCGMQMAGAFIFGDKNETTETVKNTIEFWWKCDGKVKIDLVLLIPFPGTESYNYACENGLIKDKKQYLLDGCPAINISKLTDREYFEMRSLIMELNLRSRQLAGSVNLIGIDKQGNCQTEWTCRHCKKLHQTNVFFWFTESCNCCECNAMNEIITFKQFTHDQEYFVKNLPGDGEIALWGAGGIYYEINLVYDCFADSRFTLIDGNKDIHGRMRCKKLINSSDVINDHKIESVVILALSHKDSIAKIIKRAYPIVKNIFVPDFDIISDKPLPVIKNL